MGVTGTHWVMGFDRTNQAPKTGPQAIKTLPHISTYSDFTYFDDGSIVCRQEPGIGPGLRLNPTTVRRLWNGDINFRLDGGVLITQPQAVAADGSAVASSVFYGHDAKASMRADAQHKTEERAENKLQQVSNDRQERVRRLAELGIMTRKPLQTCKFCGQDLFFPQSVRLHVCPTTKNRAHMPVKGRPLRENKKFKSADASALGRRIISLAAPVAELQDPVAGDASLGSLPSSRARHGVGIPVDDVREMETPESGCDSACSTSDSDWESESDGTESWCSGSVRSDEEEIFDADIFTMLELREELIDIHRDTAHSQADFPVRSRGDGWAVNPGDFKYPAVPDDVEDYMVTQAKRRYDLRAAEMMENLRRTFSRFTLRKFHLHYMRVKAWMSRFHQNNPGLFPDKRRSGKKCSAAVSAPITVEETSAATQARCAFSGGNTDLSRISVPTLKAAYRGMCGPLILTGGASRETVLKALQDLLEESTSGNRDSADIISSASHDKEKLGSLTAAETEHDLGEDTDEGGEEEDADEGEEEEAASVEVEKNSEPRAPVRKRRGAVPVEEEAESAVQTPKKRGAQPLTRKAKQGRS
jgi:hypothetical protein